MEVLPFLFPAAINTKYDFPSCRPIHNLNSNKHSNECKASFQQKLAPLGGGLLSAA